jgi:predicted acylesterase/phospholipase RssA
MPSIKHLVFSGGGPSLIQTIGALQTVEAAGFVKMDELETIYGTSAGAILGVILCLKFDWATINDYILLRPWQDVFPMKVQHIFDAYTKRGIYDEQTVAKCFKPLFDAKDISLGITMRELYDLSKIELHMYAFDINAFQLDDISYLTHPDLSVITALHMTSTLPILMAPHFIGEKCYIDGGIINNYPLKHAIYAGKLEDEILGFKNSYGPICENPITQESTILELIISFLFKTIRNLGVSHLQPPIKYEVVCNARLMSIEFLRLAVSSADTRRELFQSGIDSAKDFLSCHTDKLLGNP